MSEVEIENHPFEPWLPKHAKLLMLGTFPPAPKRWCMPWYYPNYTNDMWRIFGILFRNDKLAFVDEVNKTYRLEAIKEMLIEEGVEFEGRKIRLYREPSSSRAYPMKVEKKAEYYAQMFEELSVE